MEAFDELLWNKESVDEGTMDEGTMDGEKDMGLDKVSEQSEEMIISSFYYNFNKKLIDTMSCRDLGKKIPGSGGMILKCGDLFNLMADLLLDYESRVKGLDGGCFQKYRLISPNLVVQLRGRFLDAKFAKMHPELFEKKPFGQYVPKDLSGDYKFTEVILKKNLLNQVRYMKLLNDMGDMSIKEKQARILQDIITKNKKELQENGEGLEIFLRKDDRKTLSKASRKTKVSLKTTEELDLSPAVERPESPKVSGSKKKKKKKKKKKTKKKSSFPKIENDLFYLNKKSRGRKITKELMKKYHNFFRKTL